ncbi:MAG TPA: glycerol dehydrogenase [Firmicutes bacterium]|jgi:glycerol dehydrogenase|nr:glycerol dehydrogenase [Bacillota bacterium]MDK2928350.1 glycerol dehydrogenase [Bacillota bacterium]HHV56623.1 glycerol dehydrogenase [Bacillota bacterium]
MVKALISPGKYVQGAGALKEAGEFIGPLGKNALVLTSKSAWRTAGETLEQGLAGIKVTVEHFGGECSKPEIERVRKIAQEAGAEVIVGFGGGKTLDTAKAVGYYMNLPVAILPSIAATDAPCSALSVVYTPEGVFEEYLVLPRNPNLVLVDTHLIAQAPARFLVSGMGDALATKFEADAASAARKPALSGGTPTATAIALADLCYRTLLEHGYAAKLAAEKRAVTPSLEKVVEANTLLSGLGFESGGLAAAHAIHNGFTALEATHHYYHGEKVAFATLAQLVMEGQPMDTIYEVLDFCRTVGLPTTLAELGIENPTRADLLKVAQGATAPNETIHNEPFPVTAEMVVDAILAADALGRDEVCCE